ncbi:MAG: 30S ribosomal protein S17 [Actinobacteria bacterium]|nr:30S ribosomal protein S17 [Actinomycetota bacterium]
MTDTAARNNRKVRVGIVVSDARDKTVTVEVPVSTKHPRYDKVMRRASKLHVHDEANDARIGDTVRIMETRPISKQKRWRLVEVVERAR